MDLIQARSIFSPAIGYIRRGGFDWTCNPYLGCTFGCSYCYAAFLPQNRRPIADWGRWFQAKANALELARRQAPRIAGQSVYLSSVTDPYLPAERSLRLTRGIVEAILPHQPRLLVQTRGPLVVRDLDLFVRLAAVRIQLSIPTDDESVRRRFEPKAPPLEDRWEAARRVRAAGLPLGICVTPTLPLWDAAGFAARLAAFAPEVLVIQDFHDRHGAFGANTGATARSLLAASGWTAVEYARFRDELRRRTEVWEGEHGFFPPAATKPSQENSPTP